MMILSATSFFINLNQYFLSDPYVAIIPLGKFTYLILHQVNHPHFKYNLWDMLHLLFLNMVVGLFLSQCWVWSQSLDCVCADRGWTLWVDGFCHYSVLLILYNMNVIWNINIMTWSSLSGTDMLMKLLNMVAIYKWFWPRGRPFF